MHQQETNSDIHESHEVTFGGEGNFSALLNQKDHSPVISVFAYNYDLTSFPKKFEMAR